MPRGPDFAQAVLCRIVQADQNALESNEGSLDSFRVLRFALLQKRARDADFPNTEISILWRQHAQRQLGLRRGVLTAASPRRSSGRRSCFSGHLVTIERFFASLTKRVGEHRR